jgi:hypothetical protein
MINIIWAPFHLLCVVCHVDSILESKKQLVVKNKASYSRREKRTYHFNGEVIIMTLGRME